MRFYLLVFCPDKAYYFAFMYSFSTIIKSFTSHICIGFCLCGTYYFSFMHWFPALAKSLTSLTRCTLLLQNMLLLFTCFCFQPLQYMTLSSHELVLALWNACLFLHVIHLPQDINESAKLRFLQRLSDIFGFR